MRKRLLAKNSIILGSHYALQSVVPIIVYPLASSQIGLNEFGIIASTLSIANFGLLFVNFTFNIEGIQWITREEENEKAILKSIINTKLFLLFPAFTLTAIFIFLNINPKIYVYLFAFNLLFVGILNNNWYLQYKGKFTQILFISILSILITAISSYITKNTLGSQSNFYIYILLIFPTLLAGFLSMIYIYSINNNFREKFKRKNILLLLKNKISLFSSQILSMGYTGTGVFLISKFESFESAGAYAVIEKLFLIIPILASLPYQASVPRISKLYFKNYDEYKNLLIKLIFIYLLITILACLFIILFNEKIDLYKEIISSNYNLCYLFTIYIFLGITGPIVTSHYLLENKEKIILKINFFILVIALTLGIPFLKYFSSEGWVMSLIFSQSIILIPRLLKIFKKKHKKIQI